MLKFSKLTIESVSQNSPHIVTLSQYWEKFKKWTCFMECIFRKSLKLYSYLAEKLKYLYTENYKILIQKIVDDSEKWKDMLCS